MKRNGNNIKRRVARRAVGVVRISVDRKEETSTRTQAERISAHCDAHGLDLVEIIEAKGRSAYKTSAMGRDDIRRALAMIRAGGADVLVCWKIDRVARNAKDLLTIVEEIEAAGGHFASVTEQFDTATPMGRAMLTIIGALAELESATKGERTTVWQDHRRATGAVPTGPTPYGYRREPNRLIVVDAEAENIRAAAAALLDGRSLYSIIGQWNAQGGRGNGRRFTRRALTHILTSPTTAGLREVDDGVYVASDAWQPILDRETWDAVRAIFDGRKLAGPGPGRRYLLSGLLECGRPDPDTGELCRGRMAGRPRRDERPRYRCLTCSLSIWADDTDRIVERGLLDSLDAKAWRRLRRRGTNHADTAALEERLAQLAEMVANHELTEQEWEIRRAGIIRDLADAAAEPVALPDVDDIRKAWPDLDLDARRLIVAAVFPRIVINPAARGLNRFDESRIVIPPAAA